MPTIDAAVLEREDLVLFINAASVCTGQSEFYGSSADQAISLDFLHRYVLGNYRRLYSLCLVAGINDFNQAAIVERLLATGAPADPQLRAEENTRIRRALARLPPQRVYRMFRRLRGARVNNRRTRAVIAAWLHQRNLVFDAVKYRGLLRSAARHARLVLPGEVGAFLFEGPQSRPEWTEPLFDAVRRARYEQRAIYELPFTVAEGLAAARGIPRQRFLAMIEPQMTAAERQRHLRQMKRPGEDLDPSRLPAIRAAALLLSMPIADRTETIRQGVARAAARAARGLQLDGRVRAVLDCSYSSRGGAQRRNRPLALALALHLVLDEACTDYAGRWTDPTRDSDPFIVRPVGQTRLADAILDALDDRPDVLLVLSDGFENDPPGAAGEVIRLFRRHVDPESKTLIFHLNPVFDASSFTPRALGTDVPMIGLKDVTELGTRLAFARFTTGTAPLSELESWLEARAG